MKNSLGFDLRGLPYFLLRMPYYCEVPILEIPLDHLTLMQERQSIIASFIKFYHGKRILEIGCGFLPIYPSLDAWEKVSCVDPVLKTEEKGNLTLLGMDFGGFHVEEGYDTVVILGLCAMGKKAFENIDSVLTCRSAETFILEYSANLRTPIYAKRITNYLPGIHWKKRLELDIEFPKSLKYNKRKIEVWRKVLR